MGTKLFRIVLLSLLVSVLSIGVSDARNRKKKIPSRDEFVSLDEIKKRGLVYEDVKFHPKHDTYRTEVGGVVASVPSTLYKRLYAIKEFNQPDSDYLTWYTRTIEPLSDNYLVVLIEHPILAKGESTGVKFFFGNKYIECIEIEGVGKTSPKAIQKGVWTVRVIPEETCFLEAIVHIKDKKGNKSTHIERRRIIVVEPERYNEVEEKARYIRANDRTENKQRYHGYLQSIAGLVPDPTLGKESYNSKNFDIEIPDTKNILKEETEYFENVKNDVSELRMVREHYVIAKGDSTRVKFLFNKDKIKHIKFNGLGSTTDADIQKGEFVVTVSPNKSTRYGGVMTRKDGHKVPMGFRIVVVDPDKYDEVLKQAYKLKGIRSQLDRYLNQFAYGVRDY